MVKTVLTDFSVDITDFWSFGLLTEVVNGKYRFLAVYDLAEIGCGILFR